MSFQAPLFLAGLAVIPIALAALFFARKRPAKYVVRFPAAGTLAAGAPGTEVASIREAVRGADVVFCCTGATEPVIELGWLAPGAHVSSVGGSQGQHKAGSVKLAQIANPARRSPRTCSKYLKLAP